MKTRLISYVFVLVIALIGILIHYHARRKYYLKGLKDSEEIPVPKLSDKHNSDRLFKQLMTQNYTNFVRILGENFKDKKFIAWLRYLSAFKQLKFEEKSIPVKQLIPTQNEIDIEKSLAYPLSIKPEVLPVFINATGTDGVEVAGSRIVTLLGKYIIDGHHRWSQLYLINPEAYIKVLDITNLSDNPSKALKIVQLGIASDIGVNDAIKSFPSEDVSGINIFTSTKEELTKWISDKIDQNTNDKQQPNKVLKLFSSSRLRLKDKNSVVNFIISNIQMMQKDNEPILNAPSRKYMPQTGYAPSWRTLGIAV